MKLKYFSILLFSVLLCNDVHMWISSIEENSLEISIQSNQDIYGFDFKINSFTDNHSPIDYFENDFSNGSDSETLYLIDTGTGTVSNNNFDCFTDGENHFIGLSLSNEFLPATDSTIMMSIPFVYHQNNANYAIEDPILFSKDNNYNLVELDVEYGLIEYQMGWPFIDTDKILGAPAIDDLNNDGYDELIFCDYFGVVFMTDYQGQLLSTFNTGDQIWGAPAIADLNQDGSKEIIITSKDQKLYILDSNLNLINEYNAGQYLLGTPAIGNLDSDSELEIVFGGYSNQGKIFAINSDGSNVAGFPVSINEKIQRGVALADFNNNNNDDIVFGTDSGNIYLVSDTGAVEFQVELNDDVRSAPSIVNMSGENLIVVGSRDDYLYGINSTGNILFSYDTGDKVESSPIIIEHNDQVVIFFGSSNGFLYGIDTTGQNIEGFPIQIGNAIDSSPVIADFNGDGNPEIVVSSTSNDLKIYNFNGTLYKEIPITFEFPFSGNPEIRDIDLDGDLEILIGSTNGLIAVDIKDINGNSDDYWSKFRGSLHRRGYIESDEVLNINSIEMLSNFVLFDAYPNPFNPSTTINYYIPEASFIEISIHDIAGRKIDIIKKGIGTPGYHSAIFDGSIYASGKYFVYLISDNVKLSKPITLIK